MLNVRSFQSRFAAKSAGFHGTASGGQRSASKIDSTSGPPPTSNLVAIRV